MPVEMESASYGKTPVRVLTWSPGAGADQVEDVTLSIEVSGALEDSFLRGDNAQVLPSDTLRRHALAEYADRADRPVEVLLIAIAARILAAAPALDTIRLQAETQAWRPIGRHSFTAGTSTAGTSTAGSSTAGASLLTTVEVPREGRPLVGGGVRGLRLLMTTGSAFTGFRRDALTTQHAAADRPLAGALDADWTFGAAPLPADEMVNALLESFADRPSNAVQQLLTEVGGAVLERWASLSTLGLRFESLPVTAVGDGAAYEVGGGPLGVTSVVLRRTS